VQEEGPGRVFERLRQGRHAVLSPLGQVLSEDKAQRVQQQCREPLEKACNARIGKACAKLADCLEGLAGDHESEVAAARAKACELNDGPGCLLAGQLAKGFELLPKQCDAQDADACYALALEHQWGTFKTLPKDPEMAAKFSKKACMLGNQDGCHAYVNWH
jgi:TPR repeat protein